LLIYLFSYTHICFKTCCWELKSKGLLRPALIIIQCYIPSIHFVIFICLTRFPYLFNKHFYETFLMFERAGPILLKNLQLIFQINFELFSVDKICERKTIHVLWSIRGSNTLGLTASVEVFIFCGSLLTSLSVNEEVIFIIYSINCFSIFFFKSAL